MGKKINRDDNNIREGIYAKDEVKEEWRKMGNKSIIVSKGKLSSSVFQIKYQESSKMLDFCKSQQWQITSIATALNFGIVYLIVTYFQKYGIIRSIFIFIAVVLIMFVCFKASNLLDDLAKTYKKHQGRIDYLNSLLELPKELQEKDQDFRVSANTKFFELYRIVIWVGGLLSVSIMAQKLIRFLLFMLK